MKYHLRRDLISTHCGRGDDEVIVVNKFSDIPVGESCCIKCLNAAFDFQKKQSGEMYENRN